MVEDIDQEVERIKDLIKELYLSDQMPWIVGYSGGKDSTTCVQLIWMALSELRPEKRSKPVHVISTDTLVENPIVSQWVGESLKKMEQEAIKQKLPFFPHRLVPEVKNRFWVNLIGRGYPSPRPRFRWCTDRLKIATSTSFIQSLSETKGEAILVLGSRKAESAARSRTLAKYSKSSRSHLSKNSNPKLSRVWVLTPIEDWENDDVWEFIGTFENPWGVPSSDLLELYRGATPDRECPVVVDTSTQSCGDSRFGCFVCTMVAQDKSMQAMIVNDSSKEWMKPILNFRDNFLVPKDTERKNREFKRLGPNTFLLFRDQLVHGPYTQEYRARLLYELLKTQKEINIHGHDDFTRNLELISREELNEIRRLWIEEKGEIEDLLPEIYSSAIGHDFAIDSQLTPSTLSGEELRLLKNTCKQWVTKEYVSDAPEKNEERIKESYELTRNILAVSLKNNKLGKRSKQLDAIGEILNRHAFIDEDEATLFAKKYASNSGMLPDEFLEASSQEDTPAIENELMLTI